MEEAVCRTVLVTGGHGRLASEVVPEFRGRGWRVIALGRRELDVTRPEQVAAVLDRVVPDAVVNLAAWTDPDACELDPVGARNVNDLAVGHLADRCAALGTHFCHVSTDYVFGGTRSAPYRESDPPRPLSVYGCSKLAGERRVHDGSTLVRVGWVSGRLGRCFVRGVLEQIRGSGPLNYVTDHRGSPTVAADAAGAIVSLVERRHGGLIHVANSGSASAYELARVVLASAGIDPDRVVPITAAEFGRADRARRPAYSALDTSVLTSLGLGLDPWEVAIARLVGQLTSADAPR